MLRQILNAPVVAAWMLWQILLASLGVIRAAFSPAPIGAPIIVRYDLVGKSDLQATALSWAITVTPSTLVLGIGEDELYVHCVLGGDREEIVAEIAEMERRLLTVLSPPSSAENRKAAEVKGAKR